MLYVIFQTDDLLLNVAAIHQQRGFLQYSLTVSAGT